MQLGFILAILFAIVCVAFAIQNSAAVSVSFLIWRFDSTLAVVLLVAMALGALALGFISTPATLRSHWNLTRQKRQTESLSSENDQLKARVARLESELANLRGDAAVVAAAPDAPPAPAKVLGLKEIVSSGKTS
ncbi:MAG: DUF1049 domain-containing protein [Rhodocyclaceae bacterium]|nr:DUF1049 domain-containing protein [Rhodocyclaceae bacterium]MBX3667676.1 DUF1049 domain-containing protein [Rhodocyclaceae bacterium]